MSSPLSYKVALVQPLEVGARASSDDPTSAKRAPTLVARAAELNDRSCAMIARMRYLSVADVELHDEVVEWMDGLDR